MVTILPKEEGWDNVFKEIGAGASQGYQNRSDEMALQKAIMDLGDNPAPDKLLKAVLGTNTYNPQAKQNFFQNSLGIENFKEVQRHAKATEEQSGLKNKLKDAEDKIKKQRDADDALLAIDNSDLPPEKKQVLSDEVKNGRASYNAIKDIIKPKKPEPAPKTTDFQKGLAKENVKQYVESSKAIVQSQRNLQDLDRIEQLDKEVSGPLGYFNALNPFNEQAAELTALGFGVIEPIVKIFNPSGPIAQKKLEQLQNRYGISATDSSAKVRGKVKALRRYANYAKEIAEKRLKLFEDYEGNPPIGEIARLDAEGAKLVDQMSTEDPTEPKVYHSTANGKPVKAKSLEQQEELIKQGLITDVKPAK